MDVTDVLRLPEPADCFQVRFMNSSLSPLSLIGVLILKPNDAERLSTWLLILGNKVGAGTASRGKGEWLHGGKQKRRRQGRRWAEQEESSGKVKDGEEREAGGG